MNDERRSVSIRRGLVTLIHSEVFSIDGYIWVESISIHVETLLSVKEWLNTQYQIYLSEV